MCHSKRVAACNNQHLWGVSTVRGQCEGMMHVLPRGCGRLMPAVLLPDLLWTTTQQLGATAATPWIAITLNGNSNNWNITYKHTHFTLRYACINIYTCIFINVYAHMYSLFFTYVCVWHVCVCIQSIGHKNTNIRVHILHTCGETRIHARTCTYSRRLCAHMYTDRHIINTNQCVEDTTSLWSIAPHREVNANRLREDGLGPGLLAVY